MGQIPHPMQVKSSDKETVGSYQLVRYTSKDAFYKGLQMFLVTLVAAIISVVLPGIHFVSVPLGILAAPFIGFYFYRTRKGTVKSMTGNFTCPECHANNHVAAPRVAPQYESKCSQCQHELHLIPM